MLVTFRTRAWGNVTMFGDVAVRLLHLMGHSGTVPSALRAADVPAALERLKAGVDRHGGEAAPSPADKAKDEDDDRRPPSVTLRQRAHPLIELLGAAAREERDVLWDRE